MPKAEKPIVNKTPLPIARFTLDQDTRDYLATLLGIKEERGKADMISPESYWLHWPFVPDAPGDKTVMISDVEFHLENYISLATDSERLTKQHIDAIKSIEKYAHALSNVLNHLKYPGGHFAKLILSGYIFHQKSDYPPFSICMTKQLQGGSEAGKDFLEFKSQLETVVKIYERTRDALPIFESLLKKGRLNTYAYLGITIRGLAKTFNRHNQIKRNISKRNISQRRIDFIVAALEAAEIPYPDPSSGKFSNLLKNPRLPKSSKPKN